MTAAEEQLVAELAEALRQHLSLGIRDGAWICSCGAKAPTRGGWQDHQAEKCAPVVLADRRRAVAEALRGAAEGIKGLADGPVPAINDAFDAVVILRARADAVEGGGR